jgi:hypothetical protein
MRSPLIALLFCSFAVTAPALKQPQQLDEGTTIRSPDGKVIVIYKPDRLEIRDRKRDRLLSSTIVVPVIALRWTGDSRTLVVVEAIAHGSAATIIHFNGKQWEGFDVIPPGEDYRDYAVVDLKTQRDLVQLSYKASGTAIYHISFTLDPFSRKLSNTRKRKISFQQWLALPMVGDKYK